MFVDMTSRKLPVRRLALFPCTVQQHETELFVDQKNEASIVILFVLHEDFSGRHCLGRVLGVIDSTGFLVILLCRRDGRRRTETCTSVNNANTRKNALFVKGCRDLRWRCNERRELVSRHEIFGSSQSRMTEDSD